VSGPVTIGGCRLFHGDCLDVLRGMDEASVDSVVTDPPYHLTTGKKGGTGPASLNLNSPAGRSRVTTGFMGKAWDGGDVAMRPETWAEVLRVMKPGAHLVAFGGTRTYHRMVCAIEDAGFEIRDQLAWLYGSGFPKSHDIGKAIDKAAGAEREVVEAHPYAARKPNGTWTRDVFSNRHHPDNGPKLTAPATPEAVRWAGWGTALKPSHEPVLLAQKPFDVVPPWDILSQSTALIEAMLWSIAPAKFAALCFGSSRNERDEDPSGSVRWIAAVEHGARSAALSELTAMFSSPETASTFLSIVWLWNGILAASSSERSTFTTETKSSLTTGLRTLNYLISAITPEPIIRAATLTSGLWWYADAAEPGSSATPDGSSGTPRPFARESASWSSASAIASALASIAEASFPLHQVTRDCSVEPIVIRRIEPLTGDTIPSRTDLSPNLRPIVLARKPLACPTVAAQVLATGTGALNIGATRIPVPAGDRQDYGLDGDEGSPTAAVYGERKRVGYERAAAGRWPANLCHEGSPEVLAAFAAFGKKTSGKAAAGGHKRHAGTGNPENWRTGRSETVGSLYGDTGSAARFFPALGFGKDELRYHYSAKASKAERAGSKHPTVKPLALMRWLCRLVTPPGGLVLDMFAGTGVTGEAAMLEGFGAVLIEREAEYFADCRRRLGRLSGADTPLFADQDTVA
jgi:DNA modification methylase